MTTAHLAPPALLSFPDSPQHQYQHYDKHSNQPHPSRSSAATAASSSSHLVHHRNALVSHHPDASNRFPFAIPPLSAKLDQTSVDSNDALSSLWKKSAPLQEPYFQTRHTIASQHTLSTLDGVLFSLDEEPKEFNEGMYIAMKNRIFELEAKTVNYAPFNRSRKRSVDRSMDESAEHGHGHDYYGRSIHSYEGELGHSSKRAAYHHPHHPQRHSPPSPPSPAYGPRPEDRQYIYRHAPSYPSWYTPETYMSGSHVQHSSRHPPRTGDRESASSSHPQLENRSSRDLNGHDSGGPLPSPPRTLTSKPQTVQPRPILPHRGGEAGGPTNVLQNSTSQPTRHAPSSHPSSSQYPHANPQSIEQAPALSTPSQQAQQQQQQEQQRQSFHQRQHRAQQQAQSDYSRSYHLQKHMRMLDQQRALKLAQQQQQQQQQQQVQQPVKIQRQYQPHQQMYPHSSSIPASNQSQLSLQQQQQQQQHQASRLMAIHHHQQQQQSAQQQLIQRYQAQRLLQQKQLQARQLQELRQRATMAQSLSAGTTLAAMKAQAAVVHGTNSNGVAAPTNTTEGGASKGKSARPLECSNCMALDSLTWRPRVESAPAAVSSPSALDSSVHGTSGNNSTVEGRLLCPACIQYWQAYGKCRPVPPFRVNFLKKIHSRFKKELQEVRFQGWQDAQVLEVEDRMTELDWKRVFCATGTIDEAAAAAVRSRQTSVSSTAAASSPVIHSIKAATPAAVAGTEEGPIVIKIEDDDDDVVIGQSVFPSTATTGQVTSPSLPSSEVKTFMSEAAVGEVFGQRWRTEPMVGYTLVHFGGSDRTRMVPMNPTVPSLTVTFNRATESVVFAFRVLVNGLCLLSSGGGPPALHMPEMEEDEEESDEECDQDMPERGEEENEDVEMESSRPDDLSKSSSSTPSLSTPSLSAKADTVPASVASET
ncbi:hypothetical protein BGX24_011309 [Mortierella sp. AD032]|nr:hypothetical protein BGX24_011309 [Mortierella sp. AD032]